MLTSKKIYVRKHVNYYDEDKKLVESVEVEKKEVEDLETAEQITNNYNLQSITNKKGLSVAESIGYIYQDESGTIYRKKREKNPFTKKEF